MGLPRPPGRVRDRQEARHQGPCAPRHPAPLIPLALPHAIAHSTPFIVWAFRAAPTCSPWASTSTTPSAARSSCATPRYSCTHATCLAKGFASGGWCLTPWVRIGLATWQEWEATVERMGRWIDFKNDYKTLDPTFMESVWWVFSELYKKGLVYSGFKVRTSGTSPPPETVGACTASRESLMTPYISAPSTPAHTPGHAVLDGLCHTAVKL